MGFWALESVFSVFSERIRGGSHADLTDLTISHDVPFPDQLDGDYLGETRRLEFSHVPDAVRLVRPALHLP